MDVKRFYGSKKTITAPTLNELLDNITTSACRSADVFIMPPGDISDGDSDKSDDEKGSSNIADHFSSKILNAPAEATIDKELSEDSSHEDDAPEITAVPVFQDDSTQGEQSEKKRKVTKTKSTPVPMAKRRKVLKTEPEKWVHGDLKSYRSGCVDMGGETTPFDSHERKSPKDFLEIFWTEEFFCYIKLQSELYARQCNASSRFTVSVEELKLFFAILMISGYNSLPRRDMYWSLDMDIRNSAVAEAMSRNRFREIIKNLHFSDNTRLAAEDKFAKVRPLIEHLNEKFITMLPSEIEHVDVNESTVPYYSHYGC